jgi:hypothetical protein
MGAVSVQQHDLAAFAATVQREILAEEAHGHGLVGVERLASEIMNQPRG